MNFKHPFLNVGYGSDISIFELVDFIKMVADFNGKIIFDESKPDGTKRKILADLLINNLGWKPKIDLQSGLLKTYAWYTKNIILEE